MAEPGGAFSALNVDMLRMLLKAMRTQEIVTLAATCHALRDGTFADKIFLHKARRHHAIYIRLGQCIGRPLARGVMLDASLTTLYLDDNHIGAEGAAAIADALRVNGSSEAPPRRRRTVVRVATGTW